MGLEKYIFTPFPFTRILCPVLKRSFSWHVFNLIRITDHIRFSPNRPLARSGLVVAMFVCMSLCNWRKKAMPLIGPQITWSVWGLSLVNPSFLPPPLEGGDFLIFNLFFLLKAPLRRRQRRGQQRQGLSLSNLFPYPTCWHLGKNVQYRLKQNIYSH